LYNVPVILTPVQRTCTLYRRMHERLGPSRRDKEDSDEFEEVVLS
jgi:hypothetical protein